MSSLRLDRRAFLKGIGGAALALPVLNHRVLLDYTARMDGRSSASVVRAILEEVPVQNLATPRTLKEVA